MLGQILDVDAVGLEAAVGPHLLVLLPVPLGEAPPLGDEDLLAAGELELGAPAEMNCSCCRNVLLLLQK